MTQEMKKGSDMHKRLMMGAVSLVIGSGSYRRLGYTCRRSLQALFFSQDMGSYAIGRGGHLAGIDC